MTTATAASTRTILEESIKDIEEGRWVCGDLCEATEGPKPMGCALGLLQLNSGTAKILTDPYDGMHYAMLSYPSDGKWPQSALEALDLLVDAAKATPGYAETLARKRSYISSAHDDYDATVAKEELVYGLNDDRGMTPKRALSWFKRALALLDA